MRIATRVRILAPTLVLATAILVGIIIYWGYTNLISAQREQSLAFQVEADGRSLLLALEEIQHDVRFLARLPVVRELVVTALAGRRTDVWKDDAALVFASLLEAKQDYEQIRIIGGSGDGLEWVRVERTNGAIVRTPESALQSKRNRDYFAAALAVPAGSLYVSDITLNRERGVLDVPHRPMLRVAAPLDSAEGVRFGFLIINLNFDAFLNRLLPQDDDEIEYYLTNAEGDYILHPDPSRRFGFDLGTRYRIQEEFQGLSVDGSPGVESQTVRWGPTGRRGLLHVRRLHPVLDEPDRSSSSGWRRPSTRFKSRRPPSVFPPSPRLSRSLPSRSGWRTGWRHA